MATDHHSGVFQRNSLWADEARTQLINRDCQRCVSVDGVEATWPLALVQSCVVHLIHESVNYFGYADRRKVTGASKPIYRAATRQDAEDVLENVNLVPWW